MSIWLLKFKRRSTADSSTKTLLADTEAVHSYVGFKKIDWIVYVKSIEPYRAQLEVVIVEDILRDGALDEAIQGMDSVLGLQGLREEHDLGPIPPVDKFSNPFAGYIAPKQMQRTSQFSDENKPGFDVIHVLHSVILGRNELSTTVSDFASGTDRYVINIARGIDSPALM
ncbi:hypothetical protein V1517DRAFT_349577, partial [Lipomyces orientalis]